MGRALVQNWERPLGDRAAELELVQRECKEGISQRHPTLFADKNWFLSDGR